MAKNTGPLNDDQPQSNDHTTEVTRPPAVEFEGEEVEVELDGEDLENDEIEVELEEEEVVDATSAPNKSVTPLLLTPDLSQAGLAISPYKLSRSVTLIGRVLPAQIVLPHQSISREHATIEWTSRGFTIRDAKAANGSFVNEFRLSETVGFPLRDGDYVRLGSVRFVIQGISPRIERTQYSYGGTGHRHICHNNGTPIVYVSVPRSSTLNTQHRSMVSGVLEWDWSIYSKTLPASDSYVFGGLVVRDGERLLSELSEAGLKRVEIKITCAVSRHLDSTTLAFREHDSSDMELVFVHKDLRVLSEILSKISNELCACFSEISDVEEGMINWATSSVDGPVALGIAAQKRRRTLPLQQKPRNEKPLNEFRWLHVSDLHFGAGSVTWRHDHAQVMTALIRDLSGERFTADRILVTGDVAFSGANDEYNDAFEALSRIAEAVALSPASVRVIPGNHDVDRKVATTPISAALHHYARSSHTAIDDILADPRSRAILLEKMKAFREFVVKFGSHPAEFDWRERLTVSGFNVDIWGLCSVWVSDSHDGRDERDVFKPNLVLGKGQYRERLSLAIPAELNIIMTHHPLEWISGIHGKWLRSAFAETPSVHLCGHVHMSVGTTVIRMGKPNNTLTLVAGAAHGEQNERGIHAYSRCILRRSDSGCWELGWSPRIYDPDRNEFRVDRGSLDLEPDGYVWQPISQPDSEKTRTKSV